MEMYPFLNLVHAVNNIHMNYYLHDAKKKPNMM